MIFVLLYQIITKHIVTNFYLNEIQNILIHHIFPDVFLLPTIWQF